MSVRARGVDRHEVVVIGGGMSGLAAAWELHRAGVECLLLEASERVGGVIETERRDGLLVEHGPDSLVTHKPAAVELCRELGLEGELLEPPPRSPTLQLVVEGRLVDHPEGMVLATPARPEALSGSDLLSEEGKARVIAEREVPACQGDRDESVHDFTLRRFGEEAHRRIVEPIIGGLFTGDTRQLSAQLAVPQLVGLERRFGSVSAGVTAAARERRPAARAGQVALRGGMQRLPETLASRLPVGTVATGVKVHLIAADTSPTEVGGWTVQHDRGSVRAASLIVTCPGPRVARLMATVDREVAAALATLPYASCATVHLCYERRALAAPLRGFGFFVPGAELGPVIACHYPAEKFEGRVADDRAVFRIFLGGALHPDVIDRDDDELVGAARDALATLLGIEGRPELAIVHRQREAIPQFPVGYRDTVQAVRRRLTELPGLELAGSVEGHYGLADSITSGRQAARRVGARLTVGS